MPNIRKTGHGTWECRIYIAGRRLSRTFTRYEDAQDWAAEQRTEANRGTWVDPRDGNVRLGRWAEAWLDGQAHLRPSSKRAYDSKVRNHILPEFGDRRLASLSTLQVRQWVTRMADDLAPSTVRNILAILKQMLDAAVEDRLVQRNVAASVTGPSDGESEWCILTPSEVEVLAEAADRAERRNRPQMFQVVDGNEDWLLLACGHQVPQRHGRDRVPKVAGCDLCEPSSWHDEEPQAGLIVRFLAYTGLRFGEMAALKVSDLDLLRGEVKVVRTVGSSSTKTKQVRTVPMPGWLAEQVRDHVTGRLRDAAVFTTRTGAPLRDHNWHRNVWTTARRAYGGDPAVRPHDLRHTAASWLVQVTDLKTAAEILGHADLSTTQRYVHTSPERLRSAVDKLGQLRDVEAI